MSCRAYGGRSYKDLMIQCNILGRSETRACKKFDKAKEKIDKLRIRLQEVEKALEEKENEILRYLKLSSKYKPKQINLSYIEQNINSQTMEDQTVRPYATENSDVDNLKLISDSNGHPTLVLKSENGQADQDAQPLSGLISYSKQNAEAYAYSTVSARVAYSKFGDDSKNGEGSPVVIKKKTTHSTSMINTEMILMDGIPKVVPCYGAKKEAQACVTPDCLGVSRGTSKWRKHTQSISSSGDLINVGADGRGGKAKVLKDRDEYLGVSMMMADSKRQKCGAKQGSQFNIEHFFEKTQTR